MHNFPDMAPSTFSILFEPDGPFQFLAARDAYRYSDLYVLEELPVKQFGLQIGTWNFKLTDPIDFRDLWYMIGTWLEDWLEGHPSPRPYCQLFSEMVVHPFYSATVNGQFSDLHIIAFAVQKNHVWLQLAWVGTDGQRVMLAEEQPTSFLLTAHEFFTELLNFREKIITMIRESAPSWQNHPGFIRDFQLCTSFREWIGSSGWESLQAGGYDAQGRPVPENEPKR